MSSARVAHILFPRPNLRRPVLEFVWHATRALSEDFGLEVEPIVPIPVGGGRVLANVSRRISGATPWPRGLMPVLSEKVPAPTLVPYFPLPGRSLESAAAAIAVHLLRRPPKDRPQVVQGSLLDEAGFIASKVAASLEIPSIVVGHGSDLRAFLSPEGSRTHRARSAAAAAAQVWVVARSFVAPMAEHGVAAEVVPFTVPASMFPLQTGKARRRNGLLFVGRCSVAKGADAFVNLCASLPKQKATMVGALSGNYNLPRQILSLGLQQSLEWTGELPHEHVAAHYRAAECLVLPSLAEGLPCVLVEALLSGCPVVATAVDGVAEVVTSDVGRTVPVGDAVALQQAVQEVLALRKERRFPPKKLREWALQFSMEQAVPQMARLTKKLLSQG